jgi:NADH dehydrogenase
MGAVAGGAVEPRHIVFPLREELPGTDLRVLRIEGASPADNCIRVRNREGHAEDLFYDRLVVAVGSVTRPLPVPGLIEHGAGFKTLAEAAGLRDRLLRTLETAETLEDPDERASYLNFVFIGGGYAGLGGVSQMQDFAQDLMRLYPLCRRQGMRWMLVEAQDRLMPDMPERLGGFVTTELRARGIEVRTGTSVTRIDQDAVTLSTGERVPSRLAVWTAGVTPAPVVAELGLPLDERGRIRVDDRLRVAGTKNVWAIGDAAAVPDPARRGEACPPTRQHAMRQAWRLGENLAAELGHGTARAFDYRTRGVFVDLGRTKAVAVFFRLKLTGLPAWLLARWYHIKHIPSRGRRLQLLADWAIDRRFPRDSSELGQMTPRIDQPRAPDLGRTATTQFESAA